MTRIIAGFAGSRNLAVPGAGTRPTSDRVREAIFSALESRDAILGARVLDLYAGSGALGLEAASRGAAEVTLVEKNPRAASICRRNAALVSAAAPPDRAPRIRVVAGSVRSHLEAARDGSAAGEPSAELYDLVFIDPPYERGAAELDEELALLTPLLAPDALVVLERSSRSAPPGPGIPLVLDREKAYGDTALYWFGVDPDR